MDNLTQVTVGGKELRIYGTHDNPYFNHHDLLRIYGKEDFPMYDHTEARLIKRRDDERSFIVLSWQGVFKFHMHHETQEHKQSYIPIYSRLEIIHQTLKNQKPKNAEILKLHEEHRNLVEMIISEKQRYAELKVKYGMILSEYHKLEKELRQNE